VGFARGTRRGIGQPLGPGGMFDFSREAFIGALVGGDKTIARQPLFPACKHNRYVSIELVKLYVPNFVVSKTVCIRAY